MDLAEIWPQFFSVKDLYYLPPTFFVMVHCLVLEKKLKNKKKVK